MLQACCHSMVVKRGFSRHVLLQLGLPCPMACHLQSCVTVHVEELCWRWRQ
jgi:hypothetical protein